VLTIPLALAALALTAPTAEAASRFDFGELSCTQNDLLLITAPMHLPDGYRDFAYPEVLIYTSRGWQSWFKGSWIYNGDVSSASAPGTFTVGGTDPYHHWYNPTTGAAQDIWSYELPQGHGWYVMVRMWFYEGSTNQWTSGYATAWGGTGSYCRLWNYAR
jgi:hypothetical protein